MSTIKDVAALANVSIGTVSNYINGTHNVSPATAVKIEEAINALKFKPNSYARNLKLSECREIGIILPNTYDSYYSYILAGIERELKLANYNVNLLLSNDMPETELSILNKYIDKNICGLIIITCQPENESFFHKNFFNYNIPVIFIDRALKTFETNLLSIDYYGTIQYLLSQLASNNYKNIGMVLGESIFTPEHECYRAYSDFYNRSGEAIDQDLICYTTGSKEDAFRTGISMLQKKPSAVIASSESIAIGLEHAASLLGINLNSDLTLISLGQENWRGSKSQRGIITTKRPAHLLGKQAAQLLISNLQSPNFFEKQQIILNDKIIESKLFDAPDIRVNKNFEHDSINVLMFESPNLQAVKKMLFLFTDLTNIKVNLTISDQFSLLDKIIADSKRDTSEFDVYMYDIPWKQDLISANILHDISSLVNNAAFDKNAFIFDLLDRIGNVDGKYFGLPFLYGSQLLFYRKDLFEDTALQELFQKEYQSKLRPPKTWFEFNAVCRFFTKKYNPLSPVDYGTSIAGFKTESLLPEFLPRLWAYGGMIFDDKNNIVVNTTNFKKALTNFIENYEYSNPLSPNFIVDQTVEDFYLGKIAMLIGYSSLINDVNSHTKSKIIGKIG